MGVIFSPKKKKEIHVNKITRGDGTVYQKKKNILNYFSYRYEKKKNKIL